MIRVNNLSILRNKTLILEGISFHIKAGECATLMGLNGSGKSTLLKTLLELHLDYEGRFELSQNVDIAYLPEKFSINGDLTGQSYLDFFKESYEEFSDVFDLSGKTLRKKVKTYSKGTLQKLGLVHFFASSAPLKIADEIMSGLDFKTRKNVQDLLKKQQQNGTTFLFTTHTLQDATECANTLLYIDKGTLTFQGDPQDFKESVSISQP